VSDRIPAYEGNEEYLFVSYAHKNSEAVMTVITDLFDDKYRIWYDEGISPGSEWPKNIEEHLKRAASVVVFVSKESLESPNCENEVAHVECKKRQVIQYILSEDEHEALSTCPTVDNIEDLKKVLNKSLIGDGVSGYQRGVSIDKKKSLWNGLIPVAIGLIVLLAVGIYGLNTGWFDSVLPELNSTVIQEVEKENGDVIQVSGVMAEAVADASNHTDLTKSFTPTSAQSHGIFVDYLGCDPEKESFQYLDLTQRTDMIELSCDDMNDEVLAYLKYLPNLETLTIYHGEITSLDALLECPKLTKVRLTYDVFPKQLPEEAQFTIEYIE